MNNNDLACLLTIRDDGDIVYKHFTYYYNLGVRNFYALIHCGTEQDRSEIERFKKDSGSNVVILIENDPGYYREKHYKMLSDAAKKHKWHIFSDTDELLILKKHNNLCEYLGNKDYDAIQFKWYAYCNSTGNPMFEWKHRSVKPYGNNPKSIMRYSPNLVWSLGHHYVYRTNNILIESETNAFYGHFILRNLEHWKRRGINFVKAKEKRFGRGNTFVPHGQYERVTSETTDFKDKYLAWKNQVFSYDMIYEPIQKGLFVLK